MLKDKSYENSAIGKIHSVELKKLDLTKANIQMMSADKHFVKFKIGGLSLEMDYIKDLFFGLGKECNRFTLDNFEL